MRIALDLRILTGDWSGITVYTWNFLHGLEAASFPHDYILLFREGGARERFEKSFPCLSGRARFIEVPYSIYHPGGWWLLRKCLRQEKVDVYYTSQFFWPYGFLPCDVAATLHDIIPLEFPEGLPHSRKARFRSLLRELTRRTLRYSSLVFVDSHATVESLERFYPPAMMKRVVRLYPCLASRNTDSGRQPSAAIRELVARGPYLLNVGRQDPYKNVEGLIRAVHQLGLQFSGTNLVLAGKRDARYPGAEQLTRTLGLQSRVTFTDFIPQEDLDFLYGHSRLGVQPSLMEGFGLTALEPYQFGKICAVSNRASLPEVLGDAGIYFDPTDPGDMARQIRNALGMSARQIQDYLEAGRRRLEMFAPARMAAEWSHHLETLPRRGKR